MDNDIYRYIQKHADKYLCCHTSHCAGCTGSTVAQSACGPSSEHIL